MAWHSKGNCLYQLGKYEKAISFYYKSLTLTQGKGWLAWTNRGLAAYYATGDKEQPTLCTDSLPPEMQNPDLDLRGYKGQLTCCQEGLKYIDAETEPQGWGKLHQAIGKTYSSYARRQQNSFPIWQEAKAHY